MRRTATLMVNEGRASVEVRQLTIGEIRDWLTAPAPDETGFDILLLEDVSLTELRLMSTLTDDLTPLLSQDDLMAVAEKARELNPLFFGMRSRLLALAQNTPTESANSARTNSPKRAAR